MSTGSDNPNLGELLNALQQIRDIADAALGQRKQVSRSPKKHNSVVTSKKTLADYILDMRDSGFFKQAKTVGEVHSKIQAIYQCERNRVAMALLRLLKRKELRKASKVVEGEKEIAYVW